MTDEKQMPSDADDWLTELEQEGDSNGLDQLDQSDIDQLLGGSEMSGASEQPDSSTEESSIELDQAALDALLNGSDNDGSGEDSPPADLFADQGDSLQDGTVDQASLDALLGADSDDFQAALEDDSNVPSQSDIDQLFANAQDGGEANPSSQEDDFDLDELFGNQSDSAVTNDAGFGAAAIEQGKAPAAPRANTTGSRPQNTAGDEDIFGDETAAAPQAGEKMDWRKFLPRQLAAKASPRLMGGVTAALLLLGGGIYFTAFRAPAPEISDHSILAETEILPSRESQAMEPPAAGPPTARGAEYQMPREGGEIPLLLFARDEAGKLLHYEVTVPPTHGRLTGNLPTPIYLPNNNFPGSDFLEFRVSNGLLESDPAIIRITGPDLRPAAEEERPGTPPRLISPSRPLLQAHNVTLQTISTEELIIDWRNIWRQANHLPYSEEISVEVIDDGLHGSLRQIDQQRHRYLPERLFSGRETIAYRFRMGARSSKLAELQLLVDLGDHPPEIRIHGLNEGGYQVGDTVILDASSTMDDEPESLRFEWQQLAGTPVRLEQLDTEGAMVSFVVPSSFYTVADPGPVLRLTVTDRSGQSDEKTMKITTRSRRHSPLWQGAGLDDSGGGILRPVTLGAAAPR